MKKPMFLAAVAAFAIAASPAFAQTNLVQNGGFETKTTTSSNGNFELTSNNAYGSVANWTVGTTSTNGNNAPYNVLFNTSNATTAAGNASGQYNTGKEYLNTAPAGLSGNFLSLDGDSNFSGAVSQTIGNLVAGQLYTLSFDWAASSMASASGALTAGLAVTIGGQTFKTDQVSIPSGVQHASYTFNYTGTTTSNVLSFLASGTPNGAPPVALLDNVSLIAAVPEPATWAMMLVGFGMIGAAVRRRQRQPVMAAA